MSQLSTSKKELLLNSAKCSIFLKLRLYEFLQKKQLMEIEDPLKDKKHLLQPHYQRFTAAMALKDTELNRVVEKIEKFNVNVDALTQLKEERRKEKPSLSIILVK